MVKSKTTSIIRLFYFFNFKNPLYTTSFLALLPGIWYKRSEIRMPICAICGEDMETVVKCKQCGEKFCVDCGSPDDKLCIYCLDEDDEWDEDDDDWDDDDWDDDLDEE